MMVTSSVPNKRLKPMLRLGFFTSPEMNVMLCQESLEKSEPFIAIAMAQNTSSPESYEEIMWPSLRDTYENVHAFCQLAFQVSALAPQMNPQTMSPAMDTI